MKTKSEKKKKKTRRENKKKRIQLLLPNQYDDKSIQTDGHLKV